MSNLKILVVDIETAPIMAHVWGLWQQDVSLTQIEKDWHVMAWCAKWFKAADGTVYGPHSNLIYRDQRNAKDLTDDKEILKDIRKLLDEADIVIGQNSKNFDIKKLNARFILNGLKPYSKFKHVDTKQIASKHFAFTSNKLEYLSEKLCTKHKKSKHAKFFGFNLWLACMAGNKKAWKEMEHYNKRDVLATEELYIKLQPWDNSINLDLYADDVMRKCICGSTKFNKNGFAYTSTGRFQRYCCSNCGAENREKVNLLSKEKRKSLRA